MIIKVLGKAHREGVAKKSGNPYNFNEVHFLGKSFGVEGQAAMTANLDGFAYPYDKIIVGQEYVMERDHRGFVVEFSPVK